MERESFIGDTAGGPVIVYLEVCNHEVPLVMSPVMQATEWQIVHTWVWFQPSDLDVEVGSVSGVAEAERSAAVKKELAANLMECRFP